MATKATSRTSSTDAHLGPHHLTTLHAVGQALAIGPIFSVGLVSGLVASVAGYSTPLAILLGSIGSLGLAYVVAVYARRYAGAGAIFEYLSQAVHNSFGIFSAGVYLLGTMFLGAGGIYIGLGFLVQGFFQTHLHTTIPWWVGGGGGLVIAFALNHFGVRIAIRGVLTMAAISVVPFLILSFVIIAKGGHGGNTLSVFTPTPGWDWGAVFHGMLFAVTLFIGFEAAASIAEETENPRRSIPIAVLSAVALSALLYLLVTYAASIGYGKEALTKDAWFASSSPMGDLATMYVGSWLSVLIDLVIIIDALSLAVAIMVTASRVMFALGRDGLLPRVLTTTSRYHTPQVGNLVVAVWSILMLVWAGVTHYGDSIKLPNPIEAFNIAISAGSYLVELVYVFLALFALKLLWQHRAGGGLWWKVIAVLVGLATPILAYRGSFVPFPTFPNDRAVFIAIGCIAVSMIWYGFLQLARPDRVRLAARHAVEHEGVPALDDPTLMPVVSE